jgi:hypothetical protein
VLWDILGQDRVESRTNVQEIVVRAEVRRGIMDGELENIPFCPRNLSKSTVCRADGQMRAHLHRIRRELLAGA